MTDITVLVDGSNVAQHAAWHANAPQESNAGSRYRLVDAVASWAAHAHVAAVLVFDGAGTHGAGAFDVTPNVTVHGSGGAVTGDDVIERHAAQLLDAGRRWWLVTDDGTLRHVAGARAERCIPVATFVADLLAVTRAAPRRHQTAAPAPRASDPAAHDEQPTRLADTVDQSTRAALERMRRGE